MTVRRSIPPIPTNGEIAVVGLGKSGVAAAKLLRARGHQIYASDASPGTSLAQAAESLRALGVDVTIGEHDLNRIARAALLVVSPGIPPEAPPLVAARNHHIEVVSEIEIALRTMSPVPYIAVTGTNGKTTTTALIGHLLRALGHDAPEAGNIGVPLADIALRDTPPDWIALEMSSFQLHDTPSIDPAVGVLTNLTPDHLDRYPNVDAYYADKMLLFANGSSRSRWVLNGDDLVSLQMTASISSGDRLYFTTVPAPPTHGSPADFSKRLSEARQTGAWYNREAGTLDVLGEPILTRQELPLLGDHNVANALAAALAVMVASPVHRSPAARAALAEGLRSFRAPPHRLELVGEWGGVQWINDSKATNISSTAVAIDGMNRPTILLLGGRHKGEPYTSLAPLMRTHVKHVIAYGESAPLVEQDLHDDVPVDRLGTDFDAVLRRARQLAQPGDAVLLSPACSSYDMFRNYEERGARFREIVRAFAA